MITALYTSCDLRLGSSTEKESFSFLGRLPIASSKEDQNGIKSEQDNTMHLGKLETFIFHNPTQFRLNRPFSNKTRIQNFLLNKVGSRRNFLQQNITQPRRQPSIIVMQTDQRRK